MADLEQGRWYRLIGGEILCVETADAASGMVAVRDARGTRSQLPRSAFAGARAEPESGGAGAMAAPEAHPDTPAEPVSPPLQEVREPPDEPPEAAAVSTGVRLGESAAPPDDEPDPIQQPAAVPTPRPDEDETAMDAGRADGHATPRDGAPESASGGPVPPRTMTETGELDFDEPGADHPQAGHAGLSPLMLGMLLGMMVLGGVVMWIVMQARIDDLETRFTALDERLQVLLADTRRQGDALRQLVANPGALPLAPVRVSPSAEQGAELEQALAVQQDRIASLEKLLTDVKQELAASEARGATATKTAPPPVPAPRPAEPVAKPAPPPAATPAPAPVAVTRPPAKPQAVEPPEPPAGFAVILASLPQRDLATQELERLRSAGLAAVLREARVGNGTWYRVQVEGFVTREAATGFARDVENRYRVSGAWVLAP